MRGTRQQRGREGVLSRACRLPAARASGMQSTIVAASGGWREAADSHASRPNAVSATNSRRDPRSSANARFRALTNQSRTRRNTPTSRNCCRRRRHARSSDRAALGAAAGHAQIRSDGAAEASAAVRRHDGGAKAAQLGSRVRFARADLRPAGRRSEDFWRFARALFAAGFRRRRTGPQHLLLPLHAGRFHDGPGRAGDRVPGVSRRHRPDGTADCGDRRPEARRATPARRRS